MAQRKEKDLPAAARLEPRVLEFSLFSSEELKKLSVVEIQTPLIFDNIGQALPYGLHDSSLGPLDKMKDLCTTCRVTMQLCPGHMGHIQLPLPVINPLFHSTIYHLLKYMCSACYKILIPGSAKHLFITQLKLLNAGYLVEALEAESHLPATKKDSVDIADGIVVANTLDKYVAKVLASDPYHPIADDSTGKLVQAQKNRLVASFFGTTVASPKCIHCKAVSGKFTPTSNRLYFISKTGKSISRNLVMPSEAQNLLRQLWKNEANFVTTVVPILLDTHSENPTDNLFMDVIPVIPPKVRPVNFMKGSVNVHPQTNNYKPIIQDCITLKHLIAVVQKKDSDNFKQTAEALAMVATTPGVTTADKLIVMWSNLQADVDHLMDAALNKNSNSDLCHGLKQVIEKKQGCIRMHMMGKRVNFAARSVITPDPNLDMEEIGIPEAFALILTYPTPVTSWNATELRKMIINGPNVHPGAVSVEDENGFCVRLSATSLAQREGVAKRLLTPSGESKTFLRGNKVVHRHLHNGDVLLLNRQPTLHRPGIMAHRARILKGEKTLRLNYANCKAYNADFDGDEMNAHFPQNELARAEAYTLVNVCNNYLVPKDGTPLSGLIQDHVVSGVRMTLRGRFFNKDDYSQLVYQAISSNSGNVILLPPAILKPCVLWSGKQIISTVILNIIPRGMAPINLLATAKIGCKAWQKKAPRAWKAGGTRLSNDEDMSESQVVIRGGELLCGVLDKTHYGATPFGLVHCLYELYGGLCSSRLLSAFSKLFTAFLQMEGFTLGVEDILVLDSAEEARIVSINESREVGDRTTAQAFDLTDPTPKKLREKLELSLSKNKAKWRTVIDRAYKTSLDHFTNVVNKACLPMGLLRQFPDNNLQLMVQSGAKGSTVNTMQISCLLGQIELEGKRPPLMISGKSLPSFPKFDTSPRAGGFIDGRFLTGIQPQEFFFHCMAGREGLIDTAVKTSRSGYLQRCLVKHLEGLTVNYDQTVRDSDGGVVQFYYGEDGLDVMKAQFLTPTQIPFLLDNAQAVIVKTELLDRSSDAGISSQRSKIENWAESRKNQINPSNVRVSPFSKFSMIKGPSLPQEMHEEFVPRTGRMKSSAVLSEMWRSTKDKESSQIRYILNSSRCPDPVTSLYQADRDFGALTERMEKLISDHIASTSKRKLYEQPEAGDEFRSIMSHKAMKSLCHAGEPVGLLAAQSIGEPSTQMTLNTFHFAGRGEMNVTLGIPRLREVLMVASKTMKTPSMDIPFHSNLSNLEQRADRLKRDVALVTLHDVLESVSINVFMKQDKKRMQVHQLRMDFLPEKIYKEFSSVTPDIILDGLGPPLIKILVQKIDAPRKRKRGLQIIAGESEKKSVDDDADDESQPSDKKCGKAKPSQGTGEEHVSSDEDEEGEDEDATMARSRARHGEREYDDPEAVEEDVDEVESDEDGLDEATTVRAADEISDNESFYDDHFRSKPEPRISKAQRIQDALNSEPSVVSYDYGTTKGRLWCCIELAFELGTERVNLSTTIHEIASKCVLREVNKIRKGFTYTNNDTKSLVFKTDGINIPEMFKHYELLDLNRLYTNDIHGMAATYGIEAARRVIVREVQDVFKMYGITVDPRHLLLVADYMTYNGIFEPLNRTGMEKNVSPLQQMSFESSLKFLKQAATGGKKEDLFSPSSRLMIGRPCKSGTGMFQVYQRFKKEIKSEYDLPLSPKRIAEKC